MRTENKGREYLYVTLSDNVHISAQVKRSTEKGRFSAKGTDFTLAAAPLAARIGKTHHHIPALPISFPECFQDFLSDE